VESERPHIESWYAKPWPYVVAIGLAVVVIVSLFAFGGKSAGAFPDLVVDNQPTMLDIYSDS